MSSEDRFKYLPGELIPVPVLRRTFSYLETNDKLLSARVCKKWYRLLMKGRPWANVRQIGFLDQHLAVSNVTRLCPKLQRVTFRLPTVTRSTCLAVNKLIDASPELNIVTFSQCQLRDVRNLKFKRSVYCLTISMCLDKSGDDIDDRKFKLLYGDILLLLPVSVILLQFYCKRLKRHRILRAIRYKTGSVCFIL